LALAVGILVDESTVAIENIHSHLSTNEPVARAVINAMHEVLLPRLLAMLCVLAVFIPSFFMVGIARSLFPPLALAVGFSMIGSYLVSSTLVPVLAVWFLRGLRVDKAPRNSGSLQHVVQLYARLVTWVVRYKALIIGIYAIGSALALFFLPKHIGTELF